MGDFLYKFLTDIARTKTMPLVAKLGPEPREVICQIKRARARASDCLLK